jgi:hypothetical protein
MVQLMLEISKGTLALIGMFLVIFILAVYVFYPFWRSVFFGKKELNPRKSKEGGTPTGTTYRRILSQTIDNRNNFITKFQAIHSGIVFERTDVNHATLTFIDCENIQRKFEININSGLSDITQEFLYAYVTFHDYFAGKKILVETIISEIE